MLEDHPGLLANQVDVRFGVVQPVLVDNDAAGGDRFQAVHAPQEGAFTGPGRANDAHDLTLPDVAIHPFQHMVLSELLVQVLNNNHFSCSVLEARGLWEFEGST